MENDEQFIVTLYCKSPYTSTEARFALYTSGLVLYRRLAHQFFATHLDKQTLAIFLEKLPFEAFWKLTNSYSVGARLDQPWNIITHWQGGLPKQVEVYGNLLISDFTASTYITALASDSEVPKPQAFLDIFQQLWHFEHIQAQAWVPEKIEVRLIESPNPLPALAWNPQWPDLSHPETRLGRGLYTSYILLLPSSELAEVEQIVQSTRPVRIQGQNYRLYYRLPIPGESMILHAGW